MSEMAVFRELPARYLQNGNGAQSNSGKYDCRPENETTEMWQRVPRMFSAAELVANALHYSQAFCK
jgi:hypothetical protein